MKKKVNLDKKFIMVMATFIIISSNCVWQAQELLGKYIKYVFCAFVILILFKTLPKIIKSLNTLLVFFLFMMSYLTIGVLIHPENATDFRGTYFIYFSILFFIAYFAHVKRISMLESFSNVIYIYSILCICLYTLFIVLKLVNPSGVRVPFVNNVQYQSYFDIQYLSQVTQLGGIRFPRNGGIFVEPGAYSIYLVFALVMELFFKNSIRKVPVIILLLNIMTTISTTGIILSTILLYIKIITTSTKSAFVNFIRRFITPVLTVLCLVTIYHIFENKISTNGQGSYRVRKDDFFIGLQLFKQKILTGWGYGNRDILIQVQSSQIRGGDMGGISNSFLRMLYQQGLYILPFYIIPMISLFKNIYYYQKNKIGALALYIYFIIELASYPFEDSIFFMTFLAIGYVNMIFNKNTKPYIQNKYNLENANVKLFTNNI